MNEVQKPRSGGRILSRLLMVLAFLLGLVALLVLEENGRGRREWGNYRRAAEARGERLDMASVIPPAVPDNQNFFCASIVAEAFRHSMGADATPGASSADRMNFRIYRGDSGLWPTHGGSWQRGKSTDLKEWQRYFKAFNGTSEGKTNGFPEAARAGTPAADVLFALSGYDAALEELREAASRPSARMPISYEDGFDAAGKLFPWFSKSKVCAQFLQLRILAELEKGQSDRALEDIRLYLRVTDSLRTPPFLISHLVRIAMLSIVLQPVYEGLSRHQWSDAQLAELEQELSKEDLLADFQSAMNEEKVCALDAFEKERLTRKFKTGDDRSPNKMGSVSLRWMPSAYFYQSQLAFARMHRDWIAPLVDPAHRIVAPAALRRAEAEVQARARHYSPYQAQALMVFPAIANSVQKFAVIQAGLDLARVACALERYRLAHGDFPESLEVLAPQFIDKLPHDLINGRPLLYRRTEAGGFVLYSVGWDETDDGGRVVLSKGGSVDSKKGDWVWPSPVN